MDDDTKEYDSAFDEFMGETAVAEAEPPQDQPEEDLQPHDAPSAETVEENIWDDAPDALKSEYERAQARAAEFEHKHKSDVGRVSAMQREINALRANSLPPPVIHDEAAASSDPSTLTDLDNDMPEIASDVRAIIDTEVKRGVEQAQQQLGVQVNERMRTFDEQVEQQNIENQYAALEAAHPDFQAIAADQAYWGWVEAQPDAVKILAQSTVADEVSAALSIYKASNTQAETPAPSTVRSKRERQLAASQSVPSRASNASAPIATDDYDAAFDYFANQ